MEQPVRDLTDVLGQAQEKFQGEGLPEPNNMVGGKRRKRRKAGSKKSKKSKKSRRRRSRKSRKSKKSKKSRKSRRSKKQRGGSKKRRR